MKKTFKSFRLIITVVIAAFLLSSCGGGGISGGSTNKHLSKLPGIAKKHKEKIDKKKKELKECTDMGEAFKLSKEIKLLDEEIETTIEEYLANNPITNVPFEQKADYPFTIKEVWVKGSSELRIDFKGKVTITEDMRLDYGNPPGWAGNFFAYFIAVDKEGNPLTRRIGVMSNSTSSPFKADMEAGIYGSLDGPADLVDFEKLVFVSKDYYDENKYKDLTKKK